VHTKTYALVLDCCILMARQMAVDLSLICEILRLAALSHVSVHLSRIGISPFTNDLDLTEMTGVHSIRPASICTHTKTGPLILKPRRGPDSLMQIHARR
jgi:hypothetical protein